MKMIESKDGLVRIIELDPTKLHFVIVDGGVTHSCDLEFPLRDVKVFVRGNQEARITIVEHDPLSPIVGLDGMIGSSGGAKS